MDLIRFVFDPYYFMRTSQRILESQIEVFLDWSRRHTGGGDSYRVYLELFALNTLKTDMVDVVQQDIDDYMKIVYSKWANPIWREQAFRAVEQMKRYYSARTKNGLQRLGRGRPPHISQIQKAQDYRKMGLKLRDIAKLMDKHIPLIHRWLKYPLDKLNP